MDLSGLCDFFIITKSILNRILLKNFIIKINKQKYVLLYVLQLITEWRYNVG